MKVPTLLLAAAAVIVLPACEDTTTDPEPIESATLDSPGIMPLFLVTEDGTPFETLATIDPDQPLWDIRAPENAVTAPDGSQLTWDEFNNVQGTATVECVEGGTRVSVNVSGLIPGGLYTIWVVAFREPGASGTLTSVLNSIVGVTPLGAPDGSENTVRASDNGTGQITEFTPAGSTLQFPDVDEDWPDRRGIKACGLDEYQLHIVGDYHYDGNTWHNIPGPAGTHVEQFGFVFN